MLPVFCIDRDCGGFAPRPAGKYSRDLRTDIGHRSGPSAVSDFMSVIRRIGLRHILPSSMYLDAISIAGTGASGLMRINPRRALSGSAIIRPKAVRLDVARMARLHDGRLSGTQPSVTA
ncbi:hypothetical protein [Burkholderia stagnalis]|uniref:hypothetical protein n=1 Tax=Burkholderia stagnalis TaxID=1503054 RepID=UPI000F8075A3|nr:hypothetical protein [Burkholderia stagnalis]